MKEHLSQVINPNKYKSALVEAGHFYGNKPLDAEQQLGIQVGRTVTSALLETGLHVTPCLLIDDYNAPDIYSETNLAALKKQGFVPAVIYKERDMISGAKNILNLLDFANKTKVKHGVKYFKDGFKILVSEQGKYSCALLDAALYVEKHQKYGGVSVTVLPETYAYRVQQQATKSILRACDIAIPILNVYFNQEALVSFDFNI